MNREILKKIIADQREYTPPKHLFIRTQSNVVEQFIDDPNILILTGIRRCGKSTIQRILQKKLPESDYYFNFDDERLIHFTVDDFQKLLEVFIELFGEQSTFYFDEIQNIPGWERFVRRLYEQGNKIFITGSNARLLSKELGTHLTGRYIQFEVYPLSFAEIVQREAPDLLTKNPLSTTDTGIALHHFSHYLEHGGIPEYVTFRKPEYLKSLYEGIIYRDILTRYNVANEKALQELVYYFASNIGKEFSFSKLGKAVGISSANTISNYCSYLESCYLCFFLPRYSHSLKKQIQHNKKCYMIDSALSQQIGFRVSKDEGRLLENLVFIELKRRGKEVYFHKEKKECDFLVREENRITQAIQVATHLFEEILRKRELEGLIEAMNTHNLQTGLLLVKEGEEEVINAEERAIRIVPIWKWLLDL